MRTTARIADVAFNTVDKLFIEAGQACAVYQDKTLRNLHCKRLQLDEIWSFVYAKQKNVLTAKSAQKMRATFGLGLPSTPIASLSRHGASAIVPQKR
jgi:hypothetical protein